MTLSMSPAAVCQCFTLVALCTSIADPNWIQVRNGTDPDGKQPPIYIYGVAFTLHAAQNLTDTGPLGGVNGWGMWLLYALAGLCYSAVLLSSSSFLMDFLGAGMSYPRLVVSLHISTVVLLLSVVGVCGVCLYVIYSNLQEGKLGVLWAGAGGLVWPGGGGFRTAGMQPSPGESFYIAMLGLLFSSLASIINLCGPGAGGTTSSPTQRDYTGLEEGEGEDSDTDPLIPRQQGQRAASGEEWGEVFPECD